MIARLRAALAERRRRAALLELTHEIATHEDRVARGRQVKYRAHPPLFDQTRYETGITPSRPEPYGADELAAELDLLAFPILTGTLVSHHQDVNA